MTTFVLYLRSTSIRSCKLVKSEQKMQSLIAKALRTDLNISVQISVKAVSYKFKCWHLMYNLQRQVKGIAV